MSDVIQAIFSKAAANTRWGISFTWPETPGLQVLLVGAFVAAAAAGVVSAWRVGSHRNLVIALRLAALAMLALLVMRPTLDLVETERVRNVLALLLDGSLSMTAKAGPGDERRSDRVRQFLSQSRKQWARLAKDVDIEVRQFGREAKAMALNASAAYKPDADASWLLPAVRQIHGQVGSASGQPERPLCGVVVVSDGAVNDKVLAPEAAKRQIIEEAKKLGAPFLCLLAGNPETFKDISLRVLKHDPFAFVRSRWALEVGVRVTGYPAMHLPVTLKQGQNPICTQVIRADGRAREYRVKMAFAPRYAGQTAFVVSAPVQADECVADNNAARLGIKVIRDKIRVLHICGRPSWDVRFLRRFFKQTPNVDLIAFFILRQMGESMDMDQRDLSLIAFPTDELFTRELASFDLVVFQNFDYRPYDAGKLRFRAYLEGIRKYVQDDGGAFAMIGGDMAFAQGGYANSSLADVLPVLMDSKADTTNLAEFRPVLTDAGRAHPITQLSFDPEENAALWAGLPKLQGCNVTSGLRPGASALAAHPDLSRNGRPMPVIAAYEAGAGRVLAVMADTTWHWNFVAVGERGANRHYLRFWRNAVEWLTRSPDLQHVRVLPSVHAGPPGTRVTATVKALDRDYGPDQRRTIQAMVVRAGDSSPVLSEKVTTDERGIATIDFVMPQPGVYEVRAVDPRMSSPHAAVGSLYQGAHQDATQIVCRYDRDELADARPDARFLRDLAKATGGWFARLGHASAHLNKFKPRTVERVLGRRAFRLWDNLLSLSLLVGLLSTEWWLRRRSA